MRSGGVLYAILLTPALLSALPSAGKSHDRTTLHLLENLAPAAPVYACEAPCFETHQA
jgi:hypothetical protein